MKYKVLIPFILICSFINSNAQDAITPDSYRHTVYIDNIIVGNESVIDFKEIPSILFDNYYNEYINLSIHDSATKIVKSKMTKKIYFEKDTVHHENSLHIRTKKAKDGYLYVNKSIMDMVASLDYDLDKLKVSYVYNNNVATTKKDVMQILGLREKHIRISEIVEDEQSGVIIVYIFDK